jgi:hypothetical protein
MKIFTLIALAMVFTTNDSVAVGAHVPSMMNTQVNCPTYPTCDIPKLALTYIRNCPTYPECDTPKAYTSTERVK